MLIINKSIRIWVPAVFGLLLGSTTALLWYFHVITLVKAAVPYAYVSAVLMLIEVAVLKARCGNETDGFCLTPTGASVWKFSPMVIISAAVFILFSLVVVSANMSMVLKTILAFIGSISYWTLLLGFVSLLLSIKRHR